MDRLDELIEKEKTTGLTPEESDELSELREGEYERELSESERELSESERVGIVQTQWGCM